MPRDAKVPWGALLLALTAACLQALADEPASTSAPPLRISHGRRSVPIEGELREGWQQIVSLPDTSLGSGDRLVLWAEGGWLGARRESSDGNFDWQFILCRIKNGVRPEVQVKDGLPFVEVTYDDGRYFIRESADYLRSLRETDASIVSPFNKSIFSPNVQPRGTARSEALHLFCSAWEDEGWYFVALGTQNEAWHSVVRLNPMEQAKSGFGVSVLNAGHIYFSHGDRWLIDDDQLLVALRTLPAIYEFEKKREAARKSFLAGGKPPVIDATSWINTDTPPTWDSLHGKVVLVDFWGTWCGPCVAKLPKTQELHEKYGERGLVVVGVHSQQDGETCAAFVEEHHDTFPIVIDSGKTADAFAIDAWPTYFLIDRSGKVVDAFAHEPPTDEAIEKLLAQSPAE